MQAVKFSEQYLHPKVTIIGNNTFYFPFVALKELYRQ